MARFLTCTTAGLQLNVETKTFDHGIPHSRDFENNEYLPILGNQRDNLVYGEEIIDKRLY